MKKIIFCGLLLASLSAQAQVPTYKALAVGDKIPAAVWRKIPKDASTKLVILDFWSTACTSCFAAFPKMEQLKKDFNKDLQIILVNPFESKAKVDERLARINKNRNKTGNPLMVLPTFFPSILDDRSFYELFPVSGVPHHVWTNKDGVVQYITYGYNATAKNVKSVLNGEKLKVQLKDDALGTELAEKGVLRPYQGAGPIYYSAFTNNINAGISGGITIDTATQTFRNLMYNYDVISLIRDAYRSQSDNEKGIPERLVIELDNKEISKRPDYETEGDQIDAWSRKYVFTYEVQLPMEERDNWQERMQYDLNYFLGKKFGIEVLKEKRKLNSLVLIKTEDGKLTNSKTPMNYTAFDNVHVIEDAAFKYLPSLLSGYLEGGGTEKLRPVVNETGIDPNLVVDIAINGDLRDINNVKKELHKYGLDLVEGEREVEVLVIRDRKGK